MLSKAIFLLFFLVLNQYGNCTRYYKTVLVFGGNGFLGSEAVANLKHETKGTLVTMVNRGTRYWDSETRIFSGRPPVTFVKCDRNDLGNCSELMKVLAENRLYDSVVDFTAYHPDNIQGFLNLGRHANKYIYISTDSVYEVCKEPIHGGPLKEEDAVRPTEPEERKALASRDSYGDRKLACEEVLEKEAQLKKMLWISLRLPDVIGPRDSTNRFWTYLIWLRFGDILGQRIAIPPHLKTKKMSLVLSEDVGRLMLKLVKTDSFRVYNRAYNLAFRETVTLEELINMMAKTLGINEVNYDRESTGPYMFPSVTRGPLNITRAEKMLDWNPTPLSEAVQKTVQFYEYAMRAKDFRFQRNALINKLIPKDKKDQFKKKFKKIYGIDFVEEEEENVKYEL